MISSLSNAQTAYDELETDFFVKGFASVATEDRARDYVSPEEFNVDQFLAASTILVNHDYWVNSHGNRVSVGKAVEMYPATLVEVEDPELWGIQNTNGEVVNYYPRKSVPNLTAGDRGLFTVVKVTDPDVIQKVRDGELAAFSWKGLSTARIEKSNGRARRILTNIDIFELSLVNMPVNPNATLVVGKAVDGSIQDPLYVYAVELSKSTFGSADDAKSYLSQHKLSGLLKEDDNSFCAIQESNVDCTKLVRVKMIPGVHIIAGPEAEAPQVFQTEKVEKDFLTGFKDVLSKDIPMSKVTIEAADITVSTSKAKADQDGSCLTEKGVVSPSKEKGEVDNSNLDQGMSSSNMELRRDNFEGFTPESIITSTVEKSVEAVMSQIGPVLESLTKTIEGLQVQKSVEAPEAPAEEAQAQEEAPEAAEESAGEVTAEDTSEATEEVVSTVEDANDPVQQPQDDFTSALAESITMIAQELDNLNSKVDSLDQIRDVVKNLRKSVPNQAPREETLVKKGLDPNGVFDSHPVLGGHFFGR